MDENQKTLLNSHHRNENSYSWLIVAFAILALILAWAAFNRSGPDVLPTVAEEVEEAEQELEASAKIAATEARIAAARVQARTKLLAVQAELEAGAAYDEVEEDLDQIGKDLEAAYADASIEMQSQYQEFKQGLDSLENSIKNGAGDALEGLSNLSLMLEAEVRGNE